MSSNFDIQAFEKGSFRCAVHYPKGVDPKGKVLFVNEDPTFVSFLTLDKRMQIVWGHTNLPGVTMSLARDQRSVSFSGNLEGRVDVKAEGITLGFTNHT